MHKHTHVCFPEGIRKNLSNQSSTLRNQFNKAIASLCERRFSQGLYIKKLHGIKGTYQGVKEYILEARLNQKERFLFDYSSRYCEICNKNQSYIRILDYVYDHDKVTRRASRINLGIDNKTWKTWDDFQSDDIKSCDNLSEIPDTIDVVRSNLDLLKEQLTSSGQWYAIEPGDLELFINNPEKGFHLLLTQEQSDCQRKIGPVLINGSAGSGKTILGIYQLAQIMKANPECKTLYVTYFEHLQKEAQELFSALVPDCKIAGKIGQPGVCFLTFQELCKNIISEEDQQKLIKIEDFKSWFINYPDYQEFDINYLWTEIMCVIKGLIIEDGFKKDMFLNSEMLSLEDYLQLGDKEYLFSSEKYKRPLIYKITQKFQEYLENNNFTDEPGMTREAIRQVKDPIADMIVADEIQDFSQIQVELLFRLLSPQSKGKGLYLTGDLQQVITLNSFRWENIRKLFFYRGAKKPLLNHLHYNFRSRAPIVRMANKILEVRREYIGRYGDDAEPDTPIIDDDDLIPGFCNLAENEFINALLKMKFYGIDIIVRSKHERDRLQKALQSESVWQIEETKGLGFNDVILWRLADENLGANFTEFLEIPSKSSPFSELAHEFNRVYVAVTRVQRNIIVFEEKSDSPLWKRMIENSILKHVAIEELDNYLHVLRSPQDILNRGKYFFQKEQYSVALEAFENVQDQTWIRRTKAHLCKSPDEYAEIAELFEKEGEYLEAKELWRKAEKPINLAKCLKHLGEYREAAMIFEKIREFLLAAECWSLAGENSKAAICYEKVDMYNKAAENWEIDKEYRKAVTCWEKVENFARSAKCYELLHEHSKAAMAWEKAELFQNAALNWEKGNLWLDAARCWEEISDYEKSAQNWYRGKELFKAGIAWELAHNHASAARIFETDLKLFDRAAKNWVKSENFEFAAKCWALVGKLAKSAVCWELTGNFKLAAENWQKDCRYKRASRLWEQLGNYNNALECLEMEGDQELIIALQTRFNKFGDIAISYLEKGDFINAADYFEKARMFAEAAESWEKANNPYNAAKNWELAKEYCEAGHCWEKCSEFLRAAECWKQCGDYRRTAMCYEYIGKKINAAEYWEKDAEELHDKNSWRSAMKLYIEIGKKDKANFCKFKIHMIEEKYKEAGKIAEKELLDINLARYCYNKARDFKSIKRLKGTGK